MPIAKEKYGSHQPQIDPSFFERRKPPPFKLTRFIYNQKDGKFLGRDSESWGKRSGVLFKIDVFLKTNTRVYNF